MPCRPAEHDFRFSDGAAARVRAEADLAARREVMDLLIELATRPNLHLDDGVAAAIRSAAAEPLPEALAPPPPPGSGQTEVGGWAMAMVMDAGREAKRLCQARCVLVWAARTTEVPPELGSAIRAQIEAHRAHRAEDLEEARRQVAQALATSDRAPPSRERAARRRSLEVKRDALARLIVDDVLEDWGPLEALHP